MEFGKVDDLSAIHFALPPTDPGTFDVLSNQPVDINQPPSIYVGCAKWNRQDLKGFYPRGTKDELAYYSTQFNAIELNATFYNIPTRAQVATWRDKTPTNFRFFPKISRSISHFGRLLNVQDKTVEFCDSIAQFEDRLGMVFLQLIENFKPKDLDRIERFVENFPKHIPLAVEVRNPEWFAPPAKSRLESLLIQHQAANILVDTPGRRDMLHMRLTSPVAFVRFVGANFEGDYTRLDEWLDRLAEWHAAGLRHIYFFIHQHVEESSPLLAAHFIKGLNQKLGTELQVPVQSS